MIGRRNSSACSLPVISPVNFDAAAPSCHFIFDYQKFTPLRQKGYRQIEPVEFRGMLNLPKRHATLQNDTLEFMGNLPDSISSSGTLLDLMQGTRKNLRHLKTFNQTGNMTEISDLTYADLDWLMICDITDDFSATINRLRSENLQSVKNWKGGFDAVVMAKTFNKLIENVMTTLNP